MDNVKNPVSDISVVVRSSIESGALSSKDRICVRVSDGFRITGNGDLCEDAVKAMEFFLFSEAADNDDRMVQLLGNILLNVKRVKAVVISRGSYSMAVSDAGETVKPCVDDIAQIIGIDIQNCRIDEHAKICRLLKNRSAVSIKGEGMLCADSSLDDAVAAAIIAEKGSAIHIRGRYLGELKYIGKIESALMRFVYLKKYSKQASV